MTQVSFFKDEGYPPLGLLSKNYNPGAWLGGLRLRLAFSLQTETVKPSLEKEQNTGRSGTSTILYHANVSLNMSD